MKKRIAWLLMSCLVGLSLVLASCAQPAPTTPTPPTAPITPTPPTAPITPTPPTAPTTPTQPPTAKPAPGMEHFSGRGISFDYPEEWYEVGFSWEPGYEWGICFSGGTGDEPGVFVLTYALGDKTLEQFTLESEDIGYGPGFTISTPVETTVGGKPAYHYIYTGTKYGVPVQGETVLVQDGESVWWIDCFATEAEYAQNKSNFETIIESFVIE